jgi:hypothetical protein
MPQGVDMIRMYGCNFGVASKAAIACIQQEATESEEVYNISEARRFGLALVLITVFLRCRFLTL